MQCGSFSRHSICNKVSLKHPYSYGAKATNPGARDKHKSTEDKTMKDLPSITDILINNFGRDKSLNEIADDFESLELEIAREKSAPGEDTQRMAALKILTSFQLRKVLEKLTEEPAKPDPRKRVHLRLVK
jgi:hypothetical protein